jgi:ribosomal protein S18 acetylase RimI-like enzyme
MDEHRIGDITIRTFEAKRDAERVKAIVGEIWDGGDDALMEKEYGEVGGKPWLEWMAPSVLSYLQADGARSFVAERDGNVIGFCSYVIDEPRSRGTVGYNGVARDHQGAGIGSAMLDFVMSRIRAEGMAYAAVIVANNEEHAPARRNYEKHGFHNLMGYHYMVQKLESGH